MRRPSLIVAGLMLVTAFLWATPFLWTLVASFRPQSAGGIGMASLLPDYVPTLAHFKEAFETFRTLLRSLPHEPSPGQARLRLAVMNSGAPAPGMNTSIRAAVRIGLDKGHIMLGVSNGFQGLIDGSIAELNWMSVNGWASVGGSELGSNRVEPSGEDFAAIARNFEKHGIQGLLIAAG